MRTVQLGTIAIPTDFSKASKLALGFAHSLAQQYGFDLSLIHIFPYMVHHRYAAPVDWMISDLRSRSRRRLMTAKAKVLTTGTRIRCSMLDSVGDIPGQIINTAVSEGASLIVMGTHSRDGVERFLVGSTAEEALRHAVLPVIVVGPHVKDYSRRKIQTLVYATDLSARSLGVLRILPLLMAGDTRLSVVHVREDQAHAPASAGWEVSVRNSLAGVLPVDVLESRVDFKTLEGDDPARAVEQHLKLVHADLLLIGVHKGRGMTTHMSPRTGFRMIMAARCAVLSICE
ncbi:universal stress protein [Terriglobus albidus]|uniref:universal stress protein n=1 Tax=Terriglobus albidus TaxID=1592106 RepID=UPI0021E0B7D9|nr:universal stress protein [Terriglobus albidus]